MKFVYRQTSIRTRSGGMSIFHATILHLLGLDPFKFGVLRSGLNSRLIGPTAEGKVRTYDMMRLTGRQEVLDQGACSTTQMTDAVIGKL